MDTVHQPSGNIPSDPRASFNRPSRRYKEAPNPTLKGDPRQRKLALFSKSGKLRLHLESIFVLSSRSRSSRLQRHRLRRRFVDVDVVLKQNLFSFRLSKIFLAKLLKREKKFSTLEKNRPPSKLFFNSGVRWVYVDWKRSGKLELKWIGSDFFFLCLPILCPSGLLQRYRPPVYL